ncbi:MAG TPA: S53 family peptidase [Candidatus Elarobacter sp.]|jgi:subtilase family serine protease|nr:S53 family peptidase [Candidatus Elarobacter sp.]
MKRLAAAAAVLGIVTASCSGAHSVGSMLPPGGVQMGGTGQASQSGTHSTRAVATTATAPSGWAATATQAIALKNASDLGALDASKTLTVRLGLQLHNVDQMKQAAAQHVKMSPSQVKAQFGPTTNEVGQVTSYLQSQGLTNVSVEPNNLIVSATGSAASVTKAFNTTLHGFSVNGATVYANTTAAYVPTALNGIVVAVLGLNNVPAFTIAPKKSSVQINHAPVTQSATAPQPESPCQLSNVFIIGLSSPQPVPTPESYTTGCPRDNTPSDYWRAYDANTTPTADGVSVAIMAEGNVQPAIADFRVNEQGDGLPQVPVTVKQVGLASPDTAGDGEWTLDMTASTGMAGNVSQLYVYDTTSLTDSDIALEFNRWVSDDLAPVGNASFGGCEAFPYVDGSMVLDDEVFLEGAVQGQTMFASTGDTGSFCSVGNPNGVPGGVPLVEYPAASPYVTAVGGTTLISQVDGTYQGESAWDAGGGGISQFEYSPYWQSGVQPASSTPVGFTFRGIPDIAMDADIQTGLIIYEGGSWTITGGTSLASPLAAGVWARMLQSHPGIGFAPPALYHAFSVAHAGTKLLGPPPTINVGGFHDVISGGNGAYTALPNYDYTTGLGTLDVDALNATIAQ